MFLSVQWRSMVIHYKFIKPITMTQNALRVRLVGWVKKWEDKKDFNFSHFCLVGSENVEG